ncbi:MAG: SDR family oxidoreductase [Candidatus Sericytochromatia bacterium]
MSFKIKNIIIGKNSNLSEYLLDYLENPEIISIKDLLINKDNLNKYKKYKINIIINSFQPAIFINNLDEPIDYINNAILSTAYILEACKNLDINKLIYTSSSSVYGNNIYCKETDTLLPTNLHSSLKIANEKMVEKFCLERKIDFTITRIFNMYGGKDNFSIISKIIKAYFDNSELIIINNGSSIRDFININDVVKVYKKLLDIKNLNYINIGSGVGFSLKEILNYLELKGIKINTTSINKNEIKISTSCIENLAKLIDINQFINVKSFLVETLKKY